MSVKEFGLVASRHSARSVLNSASVGWGWIGGESIKKKSVKIGQKSEVKINLKFCRGLENPHTWVE